MFLRKRSTILACSALALLASSATPAFSLDQSEFNKLMGSYLSKSENLDSLGGALEKHFREKQQKQAADRAKEEGNQLEQQFKNPIEVALGSSPVKGPKDAPITVIEFSDFQCPFCSRGSQTMKELAAAYPEKVKISFKHLPLPFHPEAKPAAIASIAAHRQGKFWEMHEKLFENQGALGADLYTKLATELKLDLAKFAADMKDPAVAKQVDEDAALATKLGIRGTPGYFVNGVQIRGAQPLPKFKQIVDRWLSMKK